MGTDLEPALKVLAERPMRMDVSQTTETPPLGAARPSPPSNGLSCVVVGALPDATAELLLAQGATELLITATPESEALAADRRVRSFAADGRPSVDAVNRALAEASGELIAILDASNLSGQTLVESVAALADSPQAGFVHDAPAREGALLIACLTGNWPSVSVITIRASLVNAFWPLPPAASDPLRWILVHCLGAVEGVAMPHPADAPAAPPDDPELRRRLVQQLDLEQLELDSLIAIGDSLAAARPREVSEYEAARRDTLMVGATTAAQRGDDDAAARLLGVAHCVDPHHAGLAEKLQMLAQRLRMRSKMPPEEDHLSSRALWEQRQAKRGELWFGDPRHETLREDYPLDESSIVFDVGGFKGEWAAAVYARFSCHVELFEPVSRFADALDWRFMHNPKITVHRAAFGDADASAVIHVRDDVSSTQLAASSSEPETIRVIDIARHLETEGAGRVDLLKLNIEGDEYRVLERLLDSGAIARVKFLLVQFHDHVPDAGARTEAIQTRLQATHELMWRYPFIWESWRLLGDPDGTAGSAEPR